MWSVWLVFCDCSFHSVCPLIRIRGLWKLPDGADWLWRKLGLVPMGRLVPSKSLIQFSFEGLGRVPSLLFDLFQFALIHGPNIPGSYAILLFTACDLASITSHIHNWVLFLLWLHPFILSGVINTQLFSREIPSSTWRHSLSWLSPDLISRLISGKSMTFSNYPGVRISHHSSARACSVRTIELCIQLLT